LIIEFFSVVQQIFIVPQKEEVSPETLRLSVPSIIHKGISSSKDHCQLAAIADHLESLSTATGPFFANLLSSTPRPNKLPTLDFLHVFYRNVF